MPKVQDREKMKTAQGQDRQEDREKTGRQGALLQFLDQLLFICVTQFRRTATRLRR